MIGIDQSYADSGIAVAVDGQIVAVTQCKPTSTLCNTQRRTLLRDTLFRVFNKVQNNSLRMEDCKVICIIERIRLQSAKPNEQHFLNLNYIKGIGALNAIIVDTAYQFGIPVYSVDTRSWKTQVVGSSKPANNKYGFPPEKWPTIAWCLKEGYAKYIAEDVSSKKKKGIVVQNGYRHTYNDNKADAIGIALYGFVNLESQKLQEEK